VRDIAREKLAVVREGATLVLGSGLDADALAEAEATLAGRTIVAPAETDVPLLARGAFQRRNFALARTAAEALLGELDPEAVRVAAASVRVPGRFEVVADEPLTILDGAHNPGGVRALAEGLRAELGERPLVFVLSILDDKDAAEMIRALLPLAHELVLTSNSNPRALSPATLASLAEQMGGAGRDQMKIEADPHRAVELAQHLAGAEGVVLATGSIYLVADLLRPAGTPGSRSTL
jgi:dihydrofolate synthase/folylpolyglutamate synthase